MALSPTPGAQGFPSIEVLESRITPTAFVWVGGSGNWSDATHWQNGDTNTTGAGVPDDNGDRATISSSVTVTLNNSYTVNALVFTGSTTSTLASGGSQFALTINQPDSSVIGLVQTKDSANATIDANLINNSPGGLTFSLLNSSSLQIGGVVSNGNAGGNVFKSGTPTLTFNGATSNTFTNFTVLDGDVTLQKTGSAVALLGSVSIDANASLTASGNGGLAATTDVIINGMLTDISGSLVMHTIAGNGTLQNNSQGLSILGDSTFNGLLQGGVYDLNGTRLDLTGTQTTATAVTFNGGQVNVSGDYSGVTFKILDEGNLVGNLTGSGTVGGVNASGGTGGISPGTLTDTSGHGGVGTLEVDGFLLGDNLQNGTGTLLVQFDVQGTNAGSGYDQFLVKNSGQFLASGVHATFTINSGFQLANGQSLKIIDVQNSSTVSPFNGFAEGASVGTINGGASNLVIHYSGGDGNDVVLTAEDNGTFVSQAPTSISANGKTATFTELDGDLITVHTSKGKFTASNFLYVGPTGTGVLQMIDVSKADFGNLFQGAKITATVAPGGSGDGQGQVGFLNAAGIDLKSFSLQGDLGRVIAGNQNFKTTGLGKLTVTSFAQAGALTQASGPTPAELLTSKITGSLGKLKVGSGGFQNAFLDVVADGQTKNNHFAQIGSINITGFLLGGSNTAISDATGVIYADGTIRAAGKIGTATIGGGMIGNLGDYSGSLWSRSSIGTATIGGISGGSGFDSGSLFASNPDTAALSAHGLGTVIVNGDLVGGAENAAGTIFGNTGIGSVTINGNIIGGSKTLTGSIVANGNIGTVKVTGNVTAGTAPQTGSIVTFGLVKNGVVLGNVSKISITGTMDAGGLQFSNNGVLITGTLGSFTAGALTASNGAIGYISALGKTTVNGQALAGQAIGKVKVTGNTSNWDILSGFDSQLNLNGFNNGALNPLAKIGTVSIGGTAEATVVSAGFVTGADNLFGGGDDARMSGLSNTKIASIAKIIIGADAASNPPNAFQASKIGALTIAGQVFTLGPNAGDDNTTTPAGSVVREGV